MNYFRYCSRAESPYTRQRYGIFVAVWHLIRDKKVTPEEESAYWVARKWFDENLPNPPFYKGGNPAKAITWFKESAMDSAVVKELSLYRNIAEKYGVTIDVISTETPGEIVYEDDYQIATTGDSIQKSDRVRRARVEDAGAIAQVHIQSWKETYPGIIPQDIIDAMALDAKTKDWSVNLLEGPPHYRFTFVAEDSSQKVVGFASGGALRKSLFSGEDSLREQVERFEGELQSIYLLKNFQGQGLGRQLFSAVAKELKKLGHKNMLVRVLKDNATRGFYERMGGVPVAANKIKIGIWLEETVYGWERI
jgi:GNAT superfamily N-acetyltransferase